jgi:hypothetical protein
MRMAESTIEVKVGEPLRSFEGGLPPQWNAWLRRFVQEVYGGHMGKGGLGSPKLLKSREREIEGK